MFAVVIIVAGFGARPKETDTVVLMCMGVASCSIF